MPESSRYADQRTVFNDLGQGVLDNAVQGMYFYEVYYQHTYASFLLDTFTFHVAEEECVTDVLQFVPQNSSRL